MEFPEFIDNKNESKRLDKVLETYFFKGGDSIEIAVGYFYFSGFQLIAKSLSENQNLEQEGFLKFIISPQTDRVTAKILQQGYGIDSKTLAIREFEEDLLNSPNEWVELFVDLVQRKKIQFRIYVKDFFHAKAYMSSTPIAINQTKSFASIVGSSNFSESGLTGNRELNLGTREDKLYRQLKEWFYDLWDNHTEDFHEDLLQVIESSGIRNQKIGETKRKYISAFEMLLFLLKHYLGKLTEETQPVYDQLAEFQRIGAENILSKLERLGGAIVADSVGLGKTFTAGEVIRRYRIENKKVIVLCPPKLMGQWKETLENHFGIHESNDFVIYSQGKFAQLEQGKVRKEFKNTDFDLIVIDEAHRLRNRGTILYQNVNELHPVSRIKRADVLLLTATPFNNSIRDLENLIELSILSSTLTNAGFVPKAFSDFFDLMKELKNDKSIAELKESTEFQKNISRIQEILNAVMLLRMRSTIKEKYGKITIAGRPLQFEDPVVEKIHYKYQKKHHKLFSALPDFLSKLYLPHISLSNPNRESGKALSGLYILLMFKRIESSIYAFYISLKNILAKEDALRKALQTSSKWEDVLGQFKQNLKGNQEEMNLDFEEDMEDSLSGDILDKEEIYKEIESDEKLIQEFLDKFIVPLFKDSSNPLSLVDPKFDYFLTEIKGRYKKCLTFTEFKSTIDYLNYQLQKSDGLSVSFAVTSGSDSDITSKLDRFAPKGRNLPQPQRNHPEFKELDLLISTDVLSEGVNLQDADLLINYDLPWNPMRIVQRIGRVNRIGSENKVRVLNFIPDEALGEFIQLVEILTHKIKQVSLLLGKEMAILSSEDEEINPRTIGEEMQKVRDAGSAVEIENLSHKTNLFSQVAGESEEDIFRMQLHSCSRDNLIRKEDFNSLQSFQKDITYYSILKSDYKYIYHLYEFYGERNDRKDLLARFWVRIDKDFSIEEKHPEELFYKDNIDKTIRTLKDISKEEFLTLLEKLNAYYIKKLNERKEINSSRKIAKRIHSLAKGQVNLVVTLETLLKKEQNLIGISFSEIVLKIQADALEKLDDLLHVSQTHQINMKTLGEMLKRNGLHLEASIPTSKYKDFAQILLEFYDKVVLNDPSIRGYLYKPEEITGVLLAGIVV